MNRRLGFVAAMIGMTAVGANAQSIISAHSGTVHYSEGAVMIDGVTVEHKAAKFSQIKENGVLSTAMGRAEVLLTPGVFLRVGENTSIKLLDNRLASTRIELLSGVVMVESDDPDVSVKNSAVTILYKTYEIQPLKFGLFEIDTNANSMKVFKGQANVVAGNMKALVKEGRQMPFSAALLTERFDAKDADDLYLWTRDRSAYIAAANLSSSKSLANSSSLFSTSGLYDATVAGNPYGRWYYNTFLGSFTYIPYGGMIMNPFGYSFYNPYNVGYYYTPSRYYWNGGGASRTGAANGVALTSLGTSTVAAQISRMGSGVNTHPTLSSPVRSMDGTSGVASSTYRNGGFGNVSNSNPFGNINTANTASNNTSMSAGAAGRFGGASAVSAPVQAPAPAPAAAPAGGGAAPGGTRGR